MTNENENRHATLAGEMLNGVKLPKLPKLALPRVRPRRWLRAAWAASVPLLLALNLAFMWDADRRREEAERARAQALISAQDDMTEAARRNGQRLEALETTQQEMARNLCRIESHASGRYVSPYC